MNWKIFKKEDIKKENELRKKKRIKINYKILIDVDEINMFGGVLPKTEYIADYESSEGWICFADLNEDWIKGKTANALIKNLIKFIKQKEEVVNVKIKSIYVMI